METATKNKRGRPAKFEPAFYTIWYDKERRAAQNLYYASLAIKIAGDKHKDFFVTSRGNIRRQGIAERIGRLYDAGKITEDQARELIETAANEYQAGATVKEIEAVIKALHNSFLD